MHNSEKGSPNAVKQTDKAASSLGPVVQSIISLTSLLEVKMLTVLVSTIMNSGIFAEKMSVAFANAKATHIFFSENIKHICHI